MKYTTSKLFPIALSIFTVAIAAGALFLEIWLRRHMPGENGIFAPTQEAMFFPDESSWQWSAAGLLRKVSFFAPFIGVILSSGWMVLSKIDGKKRAWAILSPFVIGGLMSVVEVEAYKPWVHYTTPAGGTYTRYGLDALYPWATVFLALLFILAAAIFYVSRGSAAQISWLRKRQ